MLELNIFRMQFQDLRTCQSQPTQSAQSQGVTHLASLQVWVLRRPHINFFRRLLTLRGFHQLSSSSQLKCRERTIDAQMNCVDCVRLLHGGFYGHMGVAVPAYPRQEKVMGCLRLSKALGLGVWGLMRS